MKVGFVGLGRMGGAMARRLVLGGHEVTVFDRDPGRSAELGGLGASVARDLEDLCAASRLVITMLPSDEILEDVALSPTGLVACMPAGTIHMVSGTHGVSSVRRLAAAHAAKNQVLVCCAVLGRPDRASEGKLGLIAAGPRAEVEELLPVLQVLGETIFRPGEDPLSAVALKIANNFVLGCAIEATGEGMALARRYGADAELFYQILTQGLFNCIAYRSYGDVIAKQDWGRVGATATIGLKDAQLALEAAALVHVPLPSVNVWRDHLLSACGRGEEALDWAVMAREQFRASGLE